MKRLLQIVCLPWVLLLFHTAIAGGYEYVQGEMIVKYRNLDQKTIKMALDNDGFASATGRSETASLDSLNQKYGICQPEPLFPELPPTPKMRTLHRLKMEECRRKMLQADPNLDGLHLVKVSDTTTPL